MILLLRALDERGEPGERRTLEQGALTLGRGSDNDWVLTDPERTLSKNHCRIDRSGDGFVLTDQSTNGVFVGDDMQPVGRGRTRVLADGDVVTLGPIRLLVTIGSAGAAMEGGAAPAGLSALFPFTGVPHSPDSPLAPAADEPWLTEIPGGEFGPDRHVRPQGWESPIDPSDYAASGVRASAHPLDPAPTTFSQASEHASALATVMPLPAAQSVLPTNWNDADPLADATLAPSPIDALLAARPGAIPSEPVAIPVEPERVLPAPTVAAPIPPSSGADIDPVAAFLDGAGLSRDALAGMADADAMRDLGRLLRVAVEGVREILATRAMVKSELRVDQTVVQAADNSALKFAPDLQRCLVAMVGQPPQAFLPGSAAMERAMTDIKQHELAMVAALNGTFAALNEATDPEAIAAKVRAESGLVPMLPIAREARCWAIYLEQYKALQASGAENTAGSLLAPLAAAYARQLGRTPTP